MDQFWSRGFIAALAIIFLVYILIDLYMFLTTKRTNMNRSNIEALPNDPVKLKREIIRLADLAASYEASKGQRAAEAAIAANSPAATFEIAVFNVKRELEGLNDGSEDITDPIERGRILRDAIKLLSDLFAALPKA